MDAAYKQFRVLGGQEFERLDLCQLRCQVSRDANVDHFRWEADGTSSITKHRRTLWVGGREEGLCRYYNRFDIDLTSVSRLFLKGLSFA
jgi:hypothetical protein